MLLPNRNGGDLGYRYGFQGQENDTEIKGEGNSVNYKYRMHDPRVGRFFAVDPLVVQYPYYSPYQFSGNTPIMSIELEGLEPIVSDGILIGYTVQKGFGVTQVVQDINNPETQKKSGYTLQKKVDWRIVVRDNYNTYEEAGHWESALDKFNENSEAHKNLSIHEGDALFINTPELENYIGNLQGLVDEAHSYVKKQLGIYGWKKQWADNYQDAVEQYKPGSKTKPGVGWNGGIKLKSPSSRLADGEVGALAGAAMNQSRASNEARVAKNYAAFYQTIENSVQSDLDKINESIGEVKNKNSFSNSNPKEPTFVGPQQESFASEGNKTTVKTKESVSSDFSAYSDFKN